MDKKKFLEMFCDEYAYKFRDGDDDIIDLRTWGINPKKDLKIYARKVIEIALDILAE